MGCFLSWKVLLVYLVFEHGIPLGYSLHETPDV